MLVTFLVGIALGSSVVSRWKPAASLRALGILQMGIAIGGLVFLVGYLFAPYVVIALIRALFYSFPAVLTIQFVVSSLLMILATLVYGCNVSAREPAVFEQGFSARTERWKHLFG